MNPLLKDKVIFLTGGSTGIGLDCAKAYAAEGAKVAIVARDRIGIDKAITQLGAEHLGIACDVSRDAEVKDAIEKTVAHFGRLDVVHNNAGIATPSKPIHETSDASSLVGVIGQEIHAAYTATKGGMNSLTKSMALDYAKHGIRVNAVCPAGTWTPMLRKWCAEQPDPASIEKYLSDIHPLGYCPEGDVIADACVFLISDKARFVTGHIMHVSGGAELGYRRTV